MIDRDHKLPLARQAKAVGISRGSIYYRPRSVGEARSRTGCAASMSCTLSIRLQAVG